MRSVQEIKALNSGSTGPDLETLKGVFELRPWAGHYTFTVPLTTLEYQQAFRKT